MLTHILRMAPSTQPRIPGQLALDQFPDRGTSNSDKPYGERESAWGICRVHAGDRGKGSERERAWIRRRTGNWRQRPKTPIRGMVPTGYAQISGADGAGAN